jgi:hypothetical protein
MKIKLLVLATLLLWSALSRAQDVSKPILLMGTGYSEHERKALIKDLLEPNELTFEDGDEFTSAELWKSYSLVIVTHGLPALNEREIGWIQEYVKEGGRLLLTGPVLSSLRDVKAADRDWLGAEGYRVARGEEFVVTDEGKKLVPDAATAKAIFGPANSYAPARLTTAQPLVSKGESVVLFRNTYGKGEVWFAGLEYFRILNTEKLADAKVRVGQPARELLEKLILQGGAQKKSERIGAGLKAYGGSTPVVWRRDFSHARGAAFAAPPFPQKGDELQTIRLDLGRNEWETTPFYLSSPRADAGFSIAVGDLVSAGGQVKIPASALRLRVQGVAAPQLTVGPFWLLDLPRQDAAGKSTFSAPLEANTSNTFWLTLNTHGLAPGEYRGQIRFSDAAMAPLDLQLKVWPVRLPGREYFEAEATYLWNSLMNGEKGKSYNFPDPPGDMKPFEKHIADLAAHHISFNSDSSWTNRYGRSISLKNVRLRASGVLFEDAIKQGLVKENALPELDFSYFNPFIETPLLAGMPYFHFNFKNLPKDWLGYAQEITGDKNLAPDSPRHVAVKRWLLGEIVKYLRGKGITKIVSFIADEIPPEEIPDVLARAQLLHEFGIRVEFTATGHVGQSREHIAALNPAIDRWIWNTVILPQAKQILKTDSPIDKTDTQWNYVADWHRAPYVFNRTRGAFCAYHQLDGLFIHGYLRWYPNGGAVWKTDDGPIDTEGWEGARDGIEDARYWKRAQFLLKTAKKNPMLAAEAAKIEKQMARWVAPDAAALVNLQDAAYSIYKFQNPVSSYANLQTLKRELLESLAWLEEKVPTMTTLEYSGLTLIEAGKPAAQLVGNAEAMAAFHKVLSERGLPQLSTNSAENKIAFGTRAELETILGKEFLGEVAPRAGNYQVVVKNKTVAVVGGDAAGVLRGAQILGRLVEDRLPS